MEFIETTCAHQFIADKKHKIQIYTIPKILSLTYYENFVEAGLEVGLVADAERLERVVLVADHLHGALHVRHRYWSPAPFVLVVRPAEKL